MKLCSHEPVLFTTFRKRLYKDPVADRWWNFALRDGAGLHAFMPLIPELGEYQLRATCSGYSPVEFRFNGQLDPAESHAKNVVMTRAPDLLVTVLQPGGTPAQDARFRSIVPTGLTRSELAASKTDERGQCRLLFPQQGALSQLEIEHPGGRAMLRLDQLPEPIETDFEDESRPACHVNVQLQIPKR